MVVKVGANGSTYCHSKGIIVGSEMQQPPLVKAFSEEGAAELQVCLPELRLKF